MATLSRGVAETKTLRGDTLIKGLGSTAKGGLFTGVLRGATYRRRVLAWPPRRPRHRSGSNRRCRGRRRRSLHLRKQASKYTGVRAIGNGAHAHVASYRFDFNTFVESQSNDVEVLNTPRARTKRAIDARTKRHQLRTRHRA